MKAVLILLAAVAVAHAQAPGVSCSYREAGDIAVSMCTLPDGSGVETFYGTTISEDTYTPEQWTKRLATVTKADKEYAEKIKQTIEGIQRETKAASLHDRKTCRADGFVWHRDGLVHGWCTAE